MATIVDSYSESNYSVDNGFGVFGVNISGQSFTGNGYVIDSAVFYLYKSGTPTGNITAKIYAETHTTAFGTDSVISGAALATSDNYEISTLLTTSYALITFTFSGVNKITLTNGVKYVVTVEYPIGGSAGNNPFMGQDNTSPTHSGNTVYSTSSYNASTDSCFYVYGTPTPATLTGISQLTAVSSLTL